jgi:hypothetical protein
MLNVHCKNRDCLIEINFVGLDFLAGKRDFNLIFFRSSRLALESAMSSIQWVPVALFPVGWT